MPVTYHTHTPAIEKEWKAAQRKLRAFTAALLESGAPEALAVAEALTDAGAIVAGRVPASEVRHLDKLSPKVRSISEEIHGEDPGATCPLLLLDGVSSVEAYNARVNNGEVQGADRRRTSHRCPVCLAPDVVRTKRKGAASDAEARWHAKRSK